MDERRERVGLTDGEWILFGAAVMTLIVLTVIATIVLLALYWPWTVGL